MNSLQRIDQSSHRTGNPTSNSLFKIRRAAFGYCSKTKSTLPYSRARINGTGSALRYREEAACHEVATAIAAPQAYFGAGTYSCDFDRQITYESVCLWYGDQEGFDARRTYKLALLRTAIERGRQGWQLRPSSQLKAFWDNYYSYVKEHAPELQMPRPKEEIPAESHFILFRPPLPAGVSLIHKAEYGHVDLQFAGMGKIWRDSPVVTEQRL